MLIDLKGLIIKTLGDNYVNVNSRDKRREREREIAFLAGQHKKKRQKDVAKR